LNQPLIDLAVALGVAVYLVTGAWTIGRTSIDVLMDRELPEQDRQRILDIVNRQPGVRSVHDLRTRSSGLTQFIQLHVVLHPTMSLGRAHVMGDAIQTAIEDAYPRAEVILHVDPSDDSAAGHAGA
jgi:ferrous-iron efflux pump FieF